MKKILWVSPVVVLVFVCPASYGAPPDSSMPQLTLPNAALAEMPLLTASVTAATDYIFRGVSQTENDPAIFGSARASLKGFYAGAGIENVDFHNGSTAEYDLSAGWMPKAAGFDLDLGFVRYGYIDEPTHTHIDTDEVKAVASHDFGPVTLGAAMFYTPDYFGTGQDGEYLEGRVAYTITESLTASGAVGGQLIAAGGDYATWNAGLGYAITKNFGIDIHYYDTDKHSLGSTHGSHFVAAIKASF